MGSGDFGSNGSVHWRIIHTIDETPKVGGFIRGKDPNVPCDNKSDNHLLPDHFVVTLRFNTKEELEAALRTVRHENKDTTLVLQVPRRKNPPPKPPEADWEVTVSWKPPGQGSGR